MARGRGGGGGGVGRFIAVGGGRLSFAVLPLLLL